MAYSFLLYERTPQGNLLRVQADNLERPFDLNQGARLELGSTAKLRTLVSYLEVVERLHDSLRADPDRQALGARASGGGDDPLTRWALEYHRRFPEHSLRQMLNAALERTYPASPKERFFTGGGWHVFGNYDARFDQETLSVRQGFVHSVNLVFVRLMRDLVRYYQARLPAPPAEWIRKPSGGGPGAAAIAREAQAFASLHAAWRRLGYPYGNLVPSLATAIGSSGDRPEALAELAGIILNGGVRYPLVRVEELRFGPGTPYQAILRRAPDPGQRVLSEEVAEVARQVLWEAVERGTARALAGALRSPAGHEIPIGAKTGTGDNRFKVFAPGGRLRSARPVSRTAAAVFVVGQRFFGVITAEVLGPEAADYGFTSALPVRVLRLLLNGQLAPLLAEPRWATPLAAR